MSIEPLAEPPLGRNAVFLMRVSMLRPDGRLVGPFVISERDAKFRGFVPRPPEVVMPEYGSVVDITGNGIYGILGNARYAYFQKIKALGEEYVAKHYRFQVLSAWKQEIEVDWELPLSSRRTRRAFVLFTGDEVWSRITMKLLLDKGPHATFESIGQTLQSRTGPDRKEVNPAKVFGAIATLIGLQK